MEYIALFLFIFWLVSRNWKSRSRIITRPAPDTERPTHR